MKEELLHFVWKTKAFPFLNLKTTEGDTVSIDQFGFYNLNSGPDFLEGGISIGNTRWKGHIEIHIKSSDWIAHHHETDRAYDNVILHVVWEEDEIIYRKDGTRIACLELKELIPYSILESYERFSNRIEKVLCHNELVGDDTDLFYLQLNRMCVERLEEKCLPISQELEANNQDWSQILFFMNARSFGLKVNADAMESLSRTIPIKLLSKHSDQLFQVEALLYGQAGMLSEQWEDQYPQHLKKEYTFLQDKYKLQPLTGLQWKLMRMRPTAFPTIRISQLASLYHNHPDLHAQILNVNSLKSLKNLFDIEASEYWDNHFLFDKDSPEIRTKKLGETTINSILINGVIPFLFAFGQHRGDDALVERALAFLEELPAESNKLMREWRNHSVKPKSAFQSQALIHLTKNYCLKGRCLECAFGNKVLKAISKEVEEEEINYTKQAI